MKTSEKLLRDLLAERFTPARLEVFDDSDEHLGHAEGEGLSHFSVRIASDEFRGLGHVQRHRLVYQAVGDLEGLKIHSLAIEAMCPSELDGKDLQATTDHK